MSGLFFQRGLISVEEWSRRRAFWIDAQAMTLRDVLVGASQAGDAYVQALSHRDRHYARASSTGKARHRVDAASTTHDYARWVYRLAAFSRETVVSASELWSPSPDIAGTGLTPEEMATVCDVHGSQRFTLLVE